MTEPESCPACGLQFSTSREDDELGPQNHERRPLAQYDVDTNEVYGWMCPNCDHLWGAA